jgi:hypothetical protein
MFSFPFVIILSRPVRSLIQKSSTNSANNSGMKGRRPDSWRKAEGIADRNGESSYQAASLSKIYLFIELAILRPGGRNFYGSEFLPVSGRGRRGMYSLNQGTELNSAFLCPAG